MKTSPANLRLGAPGRATRRLALASALVIAALAVSASAAETPVVPRADKPAKPDKIDKPEKPDKPDKPERAERADKSERRRERDPVAKSAAAAAPAAKAGSAATPAAPPPSNFESFAVILEKNIFNPGRVGRVRAAADERPTRVDTISLVGTVRNGDTQVALFDSPDAAFRRNLRAGESFGDFKVAEISGEGVVLLRDEKPVTLKVSHQLRRPEGGDWSVVAPPAEVPPAGGLISAAPAATVEIPDNASEVLKRLMKQREKQLKK